MRNASPRFAQTTRRPAEPDDLVTRVLHEGLGRQSPKIRLVLLCAVGVGIVTAIPR